VTGREPADGKARAPIAASESLELLYPGCDRGIGAVILAPDSPQLIDGVSIRPYALWPDDRGYFLEVLRMGQGLAARFPAASTQVSAALSYPGAIKAFHYHLRQTDCWTPASGMFQTALVDLRSGSPTFGARNTLYIGALRPWQVLIPPGVAHGYKIIGTGPAMLVYATDCFYDPVDEGRLPFDDPRINYDWETQHK
jgi:dTDP-4-dehydrorhamnose 3,5-epimerase